MVKGDAPKYWWVGVKFASNHEHPGTFLWKVIGENSGEATAKLRKRYPEAEKITVLRESDENERAYR